MQLRNTIGRRAAQHTASSRTTEERHASWREDEAGKGAYGDVVVRSSVDKEGRILHTKAVKTIRFEEHEWRDRRM